MRRMASVGESQMLSFSYAADAAGTSCYFVDAMLDARAIWLRAMPLDIIQYASRLLPLLLLRLC